MPSSAFTAEDLARLAFSVAISDISFSFLWVDALTTATPVAAVVHVFGNRRHTGEANLKSQVIDGDV